MPAPIPLADIESARSDYIQGQGSVEEIAKRYGMSVATLQGKAAAMGWRRDREQFIADQRKLIGVRRAVATILPPSPGLPIGPDYFAAHGERLYRQIETMGNQIDECDARAANAENDKAFDFMIRLKLAILAEWKDLQGVARVAPRKVREKAVSARSSAIPIDPATDQPANLTTVESSAQEKTDSPEQHMGGPTPSDSSQNLMPT
jgi:hypothetical protein